jgi:hypothetical protein
MTDQELERFEQELRGVEPAEPPAGFMARLTDARPVVSQARSAEPKPIAPAFDWLRLLRWVMPATALLIAAGLVWVRSTPRVGRPSGQPGAEAPATLNADSVQLDQELVSSFDAVARLPDGEPVRFHCRKWMDNLVVSDKRRGVVIEQRAPRVEVVPVRFETY